MVERQKIVSHDRTDPDVIAFARDDGSACVQVFFIRGRQADRPRVLRARGHAQAEDARGARGRSSQQFYDRGGLRSRAQFCCRPRSRRRHIIEEWLRQKRGGPKVQIQVPRSGPGTS